MTTSFVGAPSQETPEKWWDWEKEKQITDESGAYGRFISAGHYEAINAENAALRADAERYRWLKECTIEQLSARDIALRKVQADACAYAHNLALMLWKQHYSDVAGWMPLPDLIGLLTQIDNMTAGLTKVERKCKHVFEDDRCVVCGGVA